MARQGSNSQPMSAGPARRPALRRELRFMETASVSIGVMAPTLAMSVTGVAAANALGRAAPLAFAFAALGVGRLLVSNRDPSKADDLAKRFGGTAAPFESLCDHIASADIVISSTGSSRR